MVQTAREEIFASIRHGLAESRPFDGEWLHHHGVEQNAVDAAVDVAKGDALTRFCENLEQLRATYLVANTEDEAASFVSALIDDSGAESIAISDSELAANVLDRAGKSGRQDMSRSELFDSDLGITSAQWAIAETGTLVISSEKETNRLVSLVPPKHLCIMRESQIRHSMSEILELIESDLDRSVTFITGASRTSDIELTLAIGVHGPGELYVVVLKDQ